MNDVQRNVLIAVVVFELFIVGTIVVESVNLVFGIAFGLVLAILAGLIMFRSSVSQNKQEDVDDEFVIEFEEKKETPKREMKTCPVCKTENIVNRTYCTKCNTNIKNITCPVCETKNPFDSKYCSNCDSIIRNNTRS